MAAGRRNIRPLAAATAAVLALGMGAGAAAASSSSGSPETAFGHHGTVALGSGTRLFGVASESNGKIIAVGESGAGRNVRLLLARFNASGSLDRSFGHGGLVQGPAVPTQLGRGSLGRAVAVEPNGKIVVVGKATSADGSARDGLLVERFDANGTLDRSFGSGGVVNLEVASFGDGYAVALEPGGRIVATGSVNAAGTGGGVYPRVLVAALNSNGSLDRSFAGHGIDVLDLGPFSYALAVAVQRGGKIAIAGSQSPNLQATYGLVARLTASGALDPSFDGRGYYTRQYARQAAFSGFDAIAIEPNGDILAGGSATSGTSQADAIVARFTAAGRPDGSWGSGGVAYLPSAVAYLSNGSSPPGVTGLVPGAGGELFAGGTSSNGLASTATLWALTSRGKLEGGFGSRGGAHVVSGSDTEAAAVTSGANGSVILAGDSSRIGGAYAGLLASFRAG